MKLGSTIAAKRKTVLCPLAALALAGLAASCEPKDQQDFQSRLAATQKQIQGVWQSANDEARNIDTSSTKDQIEKALDSLHRASIASSAETQKQAEAVKDQIERLDLAEKVQDLKARADSRLKDFNDLEKKAEKGIESSTQIEEQAQNDYLKAHAELALAQKAYDDATKRAQAAWKAASGP
jgi:hypothetical protein